MGRVVLAALLLLALGLPSLPRSLCSAVGAGYDFEDPLASHTNQAIAFDEAGQREHSLRAFRSAAAFTPNSETLTNLGVCLMRLRRYDEAYETMLRAEKYVESDGSREHFEENWSALMQSMRVEGVAVPGQDAGGSQGTRRQKRRRRAASPSSSIGGVFRERLLHQRDAPLAPPLPRVSVEDLEGGDEAFSVYRDRLEPFILTGAMDGWAMLETWPDTWKEDLVATFGGDSVTDFYPHNMLRTGRSSPYLTRLRRAVHEVLIESGPGQRQAGSAFNFDPSAMAGRYMHLQLTPSMWRVLEDKGHMPPSHERHWHLDNDEWLEECLEFPDSELAEEYHLKTHWKIILTGSRGAGMFNHSDSLLTSSWHGHIMGSKWWYLCGTLQNGSKACFEDYLVPGEILYYGPYWHHETQNLETPTMTITDTVAHEYNVQLITSKLLGTCAREELSFQFSGALCDALQKCYEFWSHNRVDPEVPTFSNWREHADSARIEERDRIKPAENNYDGRNYITE